MKPGEVKIRVDATALDEATVRVAKLRAEITRTQSAVERMTANVDAAAKSLERFLSLISEAATVIDSVGDILGDFPEMGGAAPADGDGVE